MVQIKDSYLEDEVRDGFYIPSIAKRAWATELSILHEVNRICEKYSIKYFADWGTFLGAIRHQGFVPWDDDLDICMFRSDLNRFIEVSKSELPEGFRIHSFLNNDYSWKFIINIVNTERMCFTPEYLKSHYNFPYMATVDIFVIDNIYEDVVKEEERRQLVKKILTLADAITEDNFKAKKVDELLLEIENACEVSINRDVAFIELRRELYKIVQDVISENDSDNSEYVIQQIPWGIYHNRKYRRELYDGIVRVPFEDTYICVPKLYDRLLRSKYGNYWEIHMDVGGHGYPYYKAQKDALGLPEDADYIPHYRFDSSLVEENNRSLAIGGLSDRCSTIQSINEFIESADYSGEFDRETVVFLPFNGEYWDNMRLYYEKELANENVDVFVVPLPYYYKDYNGSLKSEMQYDLDKYPESLPIYLYKELDLASMFPDRIYIQNPYDEFNMCMSIPEEYYASNIRNLTRKLIYIPWFETSDFEKENYQYYYNMQYYCTVPGVVLADEIIVPSDAIKDRYIDKLCEFAGEYTKCIWEDKILIRETDIDDEVSGEKILLFYTSPSTIIEYGEKYIEKLKSSIDILINSSNIFSVIWYMKDEELATVKEFNNILFDKITLIIQQIKKENTIRIDTDTPIELLEKKCFAYYGDPSYISKEFLINNKPIMISNVTVGKP